MTLPFRICLRRRESVLPQQFGAVMVRLMSRESDEADVLSKVRELDKSGKETKHSQTIISCKNANLVSTLRARTATLIDRLEGGPDTGQDAEVVFRIFGSHNTGPGPAVPEAKQERLLEDALDLAHLAADVDLMFRRSDLYRYSDADGETYGAGDELVGMEPGA
ncbi:hypothetical protein VTI74DRAFT_790 [Chaetomium olivicolor]